MKTEGGMQFPREAYLLNEGDPSSWQLRIWSTPESKVTVEQLHSVAATLGHGYRSRKTSLKESERSLALRKLLREYKTLGVPTLPSGLQEAVVSDAFAQMRRVIRKKPGAAKKMAEALELAEETLAPLAEAYFSCTYVAAMDGDAPSFETVCAAVAGALTAKHQRMHRAPESPCYVTDHSYDCAMRPVATFPSSVIYEMLGRLYQASYTMNGAEATVADDDAEVVLTPKPAPASDMAEAVDLWEPRPLVTLREAQADLDRTGGVIRNTVMINSVSANGPRGKRMYTAKALKTIAEMSEGLPAYLNHVRDRSEAFRPRDVRDLIGKHRNVRYEANRGRVVSDLYIAEHMRDMVFSMAETLGDVIGNSVVSRGSVHMEGENEMVDEVVAVRSCDLVSDPATTKGLYEHREAWQREHPTSPKPSGGASMDFKQLFEDVKGLNPASPEFKLLLEQVAGAALKEAHDNTDKEKALRAKAEQALAEATTAHKTTLDAKEKELTEVRAKVDTFEAAQKTAEKRTRLQKVLGESDLKKRHGKNTAAITEKFTGLLMEAAEDAWAELIEERCAALDGAVGQVPGNGRPQSTGKDTQTLTEDGVVNVPDGTHARLARMFAS
jgi:hypothetical protein